MLPPAAGRKPLGYTSPRCEMKTNPLPSLMPREVRSGVILPTGLFTYFRTRNTRDPECCSWRRPSVLRCRRNRRQCCASVLLMSNRTRMRLNAASQKPARTPQRRSGRLPVPGQSAPGRPQDDVEPSRSAITSSSRAGVVASDRGVDPHRRPTACAQCTAFSVPRVRAVDAPNSVINFCCQRRAEPRDEPGHTA